MRDQQRERAESKRGERSTWHRPRLRRLKTSEAQLSPGSHTTDSEGFIS